MPPILFRAVIYLSILLIPLSVAAEDTSPPKPAPKAAPVLAAEAVRGDMPVQVRAVGTVEAGETVGIKARINGLVQKVHFREGQDVRQGDLLFSIDSRELEADLRTARSNLERSRSQLAKAEEDKRRYDGLLAKGIVSRDQQESTATSLAVLQAEIRASEAAVEAAKVQLTYAEIRSPINGRTGVLQMDAGNMVKANADSPMVIISRIDPVNVRFAVPEAYLGAIMSSSTPLPVTASPSGRPDKANGRVSFIDSSVDSSTGTITLKAEFANPSRVLWPGQFADVILTVSQRRNAVIVPTQAVTPSTDGESVYVVRPDNIVEYRRVTTGPALDGRVVIESGLNGGEKVVIDGHLRLSPGASVIIRDLQAKPEGKVEEKATGAKQ